MPTRPEQELLDLIAAGEPFAATSADGAFTLRVDSWIPCVCTAIHHGHRLRDDLARRCLLSDVERLQEEDPHTGDLIAAMPITLVANDSRYEYDLNRPLAQCVYKVAWGKKVWRRPPTLKQHALSREKHRAFYRVLDALVATLEERFGACLVFDVHSYNRGRLDGSPPAFNLGTSQIDATRWRTLVDHFRRQLAAIEVPSQPLRVAVDEVFQGRGYLIGHVNAQHADTLVIPTEVGKFFMNEETGDPFPLTFEALSAGFKNALAESAAAFARRHTGRRRARRHDMLAPGLDPALVDVDRQLFGLVRGIETLLYVSPINVPQARRSFFRTGQSPTFVYRPLAIDPYQLRSRLYRLPVERIGDPEIQQLYRAVIDMLAVRIDLLTSIGSERFLYNSLRHFGEPDQRDLANARFILHAMANHEGGESETMDAAVAQERMRAQAETWGMKCRVERSRRIVARALVNNGRRALVVNSDARFTETELQALIHHELGIHMATTLNALEQPLKIFALGLPLNTLTQEGLAILNEYLAGHLTLERLQGLALRVVAIDLMLRHHDFAHTVEILQDEFGQSRTAAFDLAVRVFRGGGLTKDYLYLRGLREAHALWRRRSVENLMIGKTSLEWLDLIDELRARDLVKAPRFVPATFTDPVAADPVLEFVIRSIQEPGTSPG